MSVWSTQKANMASANIKLNPVGIIIILLIVASILLYLTGFPVFMSSRNSGTVNMKLLLSAAIDAAEIGGREVTRIHKTHKLDVEAKETLTDEGKKELKTVGDMASHNVMYHGLQQAFPSLRDKIQSEEHDDNTFDYSKITLPNTQLSEVSNIVGDDVSVDAITVWIDPLDATQEYTEGLTHFVTTMVCVAVEDKPTIGVIHFPFTKETVWAYVDKGTSGNLKQADQMNHDATKPYKVIVSRSHTGEVTPVLKESLGENTEVTYAGGAGYKTREVIVGNADAYVHVTNIKKWDICAGNAIINAVKGEMTTLHNKKIDYSHNAPGGKENHEGLLAAIRDHSLLQGKLQAPFDKLKEKSAKTAL